MSSSELQSALTSRWSGGWFRCKPGESRRTSCRHGYSLTARSLRKTSSSLSSALMRQSIICSAPINAFAFDLIGVVYSACSTSSCKSYALPER